MSAPPEQLGPYKILDTLGSGNFGTVYLAQGEVRRKGGRPSKRMHVAVKQLHDPGDQSALQQLRSEFELLEQVMHRSLCKVHDFLEDEAAVVMEVVEGRTLREVLEVLERHGEPMPTEAAVEIGCELADCLSQCWGTVGRDGQPLRLVHRDLKPENVMLTARGEVKILDFGLARVQLKRGRGRDRSVKGTPLYMAPEQALGRGTDHQTDLFAVGLILYELLVGRPAYEISDDVDDPEGDIMRRIEHAELGAQLRLLHDRLPGPGPVVARCLQASPRARYDTGHELLLDLRSQLVRDRGAYLADFCDYFFHNLDPDFAADASAAQKRGRGGTASDPERSDHRRDTMANKPSGPPRPGGRPPRPGGRPGGPARPGGGPPRRGPPSRPGPAGPPSGGPRKVAPPKPPGPPSPKPPSGGGPKKPPPTKPPGMGDAKTGKETGMLQMVPLQKNEEEEDIGGAPKSATQFFAIPKSKKAKSKPSPGGGGAAIGGPKPAGRTLPGAGAAGGAPSPIGAAPAAPGGALGSISGPTSGGGIGGPIAAGPTASIGSTGGAASPFQVGGAPDTGGAPEQRARSMRIYVIILALFGFAFLSMIAAVGAIVVGTQMSGEESEEVAEKSSSRDKDKDKDKDKGEERDTAAAVDEEEPPPPPPPRRRTTTRRTTSSAPAPSRPRAPAGPGAGVVKITLSGATALNVEIKCPSGFRKRGAFQGGTANISGVPGGEDCTAMLKGGAPLQAKGIRANRSYTCSPAGSVLSCK